MFDPETIERYYDPGRGEMLEHDPKAVEFGRMGDLISYVHSSDYDSLLKLYREAVECLDDMVHQHCRDRNGLFSGFLSANSNAMRFLGEIGKLQIQDAGGRVISAAFTENT